MGETFRKILHHPVTAWVVLLASFLLTWMAWRISTTFVQERAADRFRFEVEEVTGAIRKRMLEYEALLRSGVGLFHASDSVSRRDWEHFVATLSIERYFPGIQGIGYSKMIPAADLQAHIAGIRAEGFRHYAVRPEGEREMYSAIVYLEPFDWRNQRAFGYDMLSEPVRRAAMERARDTGDAAVTGIVTLVQETTTDVQRGFLMYLPLYRKGASVETVEQRRTALEGFVYSPFRIRNLLRGILGPGKRNISFEIFDGADVSARSLLYDHADGGPRAGEEDRAPDFVSTATIPMAGHVWTLRIHTLPGFIEAAEASQPLVVAISGVLVDLLLFFIIASIAGQQKRAVALAEAMTRELRDSKTALLEKAFALEQVNNSLDQFTHVLAHHLQESVRRQYAFAQRLEALLPAPLSPEAGKALVHVLNGAHRLHELLHDVGLYLSAHRLPPPEKPCDADAALDAALRQVGGAVAEAGVTVVRVPLPAVWIGQPQLTDVFSALLDNAIRFRHPERPARIVIDASKGGGQVVLSVCDNGIGIAPQYRARVFDVFEQLRRDLGPSSTGIGLSLAQRIVESAGGRIWIEDGDQGGICVRVALRNGEE
ncbi:MAG: CHASE domain-containing protein [Alphaproteobacteria bacterium]|nr:CHASE domain-containing protein [Alphaproteobacteria bacterium]